MEYTNDIRHTITTADAKISIRLNDECKNGHEDFSLTAVIYEAGKPHTDKNMIAGGCCHEEILKVRPDLAIFARLHLADSDGVPMHAVANGFYHLREGFYTVKPNNEAFPAMYCEEYRISPEQFQALRTVRNELQFSLALRDLGILKQWKEEAEEAIELLRTMTGKRFKSSAVRSQYTAPTPEQIAEEEEKQRTGYYTPEAEAQRAEERKMQRLQKLIQERDRKLANTAAEYDVLEQVLRIGGENALENCIYYSHTRQIAFNWSTYGKQLTPQEIETIKSQLVLKNGITIDESPRKK